MALGKLKSAFVGGLMAASAAVMPLTSSADEPPRPGSFLADDIRTASPFILEHAPFAASNGRLAVIMYGSDQMILSAVGSAAKHYATKKPGNVDVTFLLAPDNDGNEGTALVGIFANGRHFGEFKIGNRNSAQDIASAIYRALGNADREILKNPKYAQAADTQAPAPAN